MTNASLYYKYLTLLHQNFLNITTTISMLQVFQRRQYTILKKNRKMKKG